jgi:two-component system CheB/CheR fusion protein
MPDGGTVVTHEDITDKARAEMTLSESRAQFSDLFELAPIGLLLVGDSGRIELANKEAGQIFGYVADDMIGMMIENLVPEKDRRSDEGLRHAFKASGKLQGTMVMRDEVSALRKDGSIVPTEVKLSPINILGERHTCVVVRDLTERKAVDAQLRQAQKMEAVGQLTGGLAHDFNNLLMIMIGNLEVLQALSQDPQQNELLDLVLDAATRGADLTQRLLAFSRRQPLQADVCDINELLNATTALLRRTIGENVTVDLQLSSDALTASVDRGQFESVILNMAINARDAMPSGGVVTIATKMMAVASDADAKAYGDVGWGEYVAIVISDTGSGMSPEVVARVFEPFFTTKGKGKGTGLGLSMVYGFIKQSGGGIKIDSELGCGTSITLLLPLAVTEAQASTGALASSGTDVQPKANVILAVDDNHAVRETAVRNLRSLGYQVVEAKNADEAMQKLESGEKIDLLFTDIIMPGELDGIGLAKWARTRYPNLKILYTSGFPGTEEGRSEVQQVDGRLLQKPYRRKGLQEAVEQVLAAA